MKDIKLIMAIISAVALGACTGGGSGDGGLAPVNAPITTPTNSFAGLDATDVNSQNTSLTGMASHNIANQDTVNANMYDYVATRLPGFNLPSGAKSRRAASMRDNPPPSAQDIAAAIAKINEMKGVLLDLTSSNVNLIAYVTNNRQLVAEALRLYGDDIDVENATVTELIAAFNAHDFANGTDALVGFDNAHNGDFGIEDLSNVDFKLVGGDDMIIHFTLDENGRITQAGGGSIGENGFEISPEYGWFNRDSGNVGTFSALWQKYTIGLGDVLASLVYGESGDLQGNGHNAGAHLSLFSLFQAHGGGNGIMNPKFTRPFEFDLEDATDIAKIRNELINQFNAEVDKFINSQPADTPPATLAQLRADAEMLFNATLNDDGWWNTHIEYIVHSTSDVHIAFTGVGKDVEFNGKKLKYSDFGYITMNENNQLDYQPYTGGYASRKITTTPESTVTYKGTAIAGLSATGAAPRLLRQDGAELVHYAGTGISELTMNNLQYQGDDENLHDWYTMVVTTHDNAGSVDELQFAFSGDDKNIAEAYQFLGDDNLATEENDYTLGVNLVSGGTMQSGVHQSEGEYVLGSGDTSWRGSAEANYYGENGVESEATMGFHFTEDYHPTGQDEHEVSIYGAFGGVEYTPSSGD